MSRKMKLTCILCCLLALIVKASSAIGYSEEALVGRARIGVTVTTLSGDAVNNGEVPHGAYVTNVEDASPAAAAGIQLFDIIIQANDELVLSSDDLTGVIDLLQTGDSADLLIYRIGEDLSKVKEIPRGKYVNCTVTLSAIDDNADILVSEDVAGEKAAISSPTPSSDLIEVSAESDDKTKTKLELSNGEITLSKGKNQKLTATVSDLEEGVKLAKTTWTSANPAVAKVQNGTVTGTGNGSTVITCTVLLTDGTELTSSCKVTGIVAATAISVNPKSYTLSIGQTMDLSVDFKPENVTSKELEYSSEDPHIISVSKDGRMVALHGGQTNVTIATTDGSNKSTKVLVYVPSFTTNQLEYTCTSKKGMNITLKYYGTSRNLSVTSSKGNASISHSLSGYDLTINVIPIKAGSVSVNLSDKSNKKSKVTLKIKIDHSAVYDKVSYPNIKYDNASRYPSSYKGKNCSFSGKVLQVMNGSNSNTYRISSKGNWDNVVYVTINKNNIQIPIIDGDKVTVFGTYDGNETYTSILGASITIPAVKAERIIVK